MSIYARAGVVTNVTPEQVREYIRSHDEGDFQLVDVRQPEEYEQGHIPGARLIPLGEFDQRRVELEELSGKKAIFYCRSGGRSGRASAWASQTFRLPEVYNLAGGMMGWNGVEVPDFPRVAALELGGGLEALLRRAFDLEKGTHGLYELVAEEYATGPVATTVSQLAKAEVAHARVVHRLLAQVGAKQTDDFDSMFAQAPGNLVESGESYDAVVERARSLKGQGNVAILEFALEIELNAYDLYKSLATRAPDKDAERALYELAQQEKRHADGLMKAMGELAKLSQ